MKMLLTQIDSKLKWLMIVDDIWKNITDMVFDDVRTGVDDLKVAVYPNVGRKCEICFKDRFEVCSQVTIFFSSLLSLPTIASKDSSLCGESAFFMGSINIIFSEDSDCWRSCLYCTSNVATSGFFWTKSQKWWFFFLLKCQKDCGFILIFFHIRRRKGKDAFGFGNTQEEKCWSLMMHDWKCHVLSVWRSIRRYTRCFDWRLNPSKHNLLSSNEGRVFWYCWRVLELHEVRCID